jgi:electron transport complex protein RnfD
VLGRCGGSIGETCAVALIIGGLYLLWRGHISWQMPLGYLGSFFVLMFLLGGDGADGAVRHLFMGGLMLGAWFMATDMVTSPLTLRGQLLGGVLCGLLTFVIRLKGGYPEGVSYSILIMNAATPLIDKLTVPKKYGAVKKNA